MILKQALTNTSALADGYDVDGEFSVSTDSTTQAAFLIKH